jgi:uncharacterized membrane protein YhhN
MMNLLLSLIVIAISAVFTIYGKYKRQKFIHYAFKPLTMVMILSLAWERTTASPSVYSYLILSGLCLSLLGDIFVMLPGNKFIKPGLLAFLAGYLLYILAFSWNIRIVSYPPLLLILALGAVAYLYLYSRLDKMRLPVLIYVVVVSVMVWLAINRYLSFLDQKGFLVMVGGILLLLSESVWGLNRFRKQFWLAEILILGTYFPAQVLFALSIP